MSLRRFAWFVLVYNLGVIAWGAYVRATRSGAGCGAHWPLCNGEVLPQAPTLAMLIEFSHRASSGLALVSVVALAIWTWRATRAGHPARRATAWAVAFMLTEAAVGAALVLFQLVADNPSMARAMFMSVHLVNTFVLLAWLALAAYWLSGAPDVRVRPHGGRAAWLTLGGIGLLLAGVSGAVAALGDTLYPAGSLRDALGADLSATSHLFVRLRLLHPTLTVVVAAAMALAGLHTRRESAGITARLGTALAWLVGAQLLAGLVNVLLLAPVWMQLVHLMVADAIWICYVLMGAGLLAEPEPVAV